MDSAGNGIRLVAFDLDGVLVDGEGSWNAMHRGLGTLEQSRRNGEEFYSGKISFEEWARRDVELWRGVDVETIKEILYSIPLTKGIDKTMKTLRDKNYKIAIISGGIKTLADHVAELYDIDYVYGNDLLIKDSKVAGIRHVVDFDSKGRILRDVAAREGLGSKECAAVGDYLNDIPMFREAGFSIAFNPKNPEVAAAADTVVWGNDLSLILRYL